MAHPTSRWSARETLILLAFVVVAIGIPLLITVYGQSDAERTSTIVFYGLFGLFVFLMVRFKRAADVYERFFTWYLRFASGLFVMTVPYIFFAWLSRVLLARLPLWLQMACFVLWGVLLGAALLLISTKQWRQRVLEPLARYHIALPAAYSFQVLMLACLFFSSVTFVLVQSNLMSMTGGSADAVTPGSISDFFLWHFLDAVPLLKVNETLGWRPPLTYDSVSVGCMLLLFKAVVILPVIGAFTWYGTRETAATERREEVATVAV